jgi:hypothetical protein
VDRGPPERPHPRLLTLACTARATAVAPQAAPPEAAHGALAPSPTEPAPAAPVAEAGVVYLVEPTARGLEPLAGALRDLWSGALFYEGPREGLQIVGVEVMQDGCRRCQMTLGTVTGIVFPDRQVADWSSPDWTYSTFASGRRSSASLATTPAPRPNLRRARTGREENDDPYPCLRRRRLARRLDTGDLPAPPAPGGWSTALARVRPAASPC